MGYRRKARECALQVLFEIDMTAIDPSGALSVYWQSHPAPDPVRSYAERIVHGAVADRGRIDTLIQESSTHWRLERMPHVDRNVLRLATYELLHEAETPRSVILNEAIEVAKKFGTDESAQFVNGVLDAIRKEIEAVAPPGIR